MSYLVDVILRIKGITGAKTDAEIAKMLNLRPNTLAERKKRDSLPYRELFIFSHQNRISLNWLLTGKGFKYMSKYSSKAQNLDKEE